MGRRRRLSYRRAVAPDDGLQLRLADGGNTLPSALDPEPTHPALRATFSRKVLGWVVPGERPRFPFMANHF